MGILDIGVLLFYVVVVQSFFVDCSPAYVADCRESIDATPMNAAS